MVHHSKCDFLQVLLVVHRSVRDLLVLLQVDRNIQDFPVLQVHRKVFLVSQVLLDSL